MEQHGLQGGGTSLHSTVAASAGRGSSLLQHNCSLMMSVSQETGREGS